ncbi:type II toxin-antitoxin system prevent-host-death family antitoxin [Rhodococcus erythropolis]|uniref:type II toxin-antitoxin system Phd/YefM family antitoxin n=1 Tax=Rhodococcus erythropolis TaxID=1833 RepID=UPI001BAC4D4B|nr:type II toxin-antitoxin system prevent-host-death family antitoxin [Rhodococcus erythropolis]MBS2991421.1 type II toxin-antitoxin system prevent-host-death family antitoxin [Rhodococcus erythropolis]
MSNAITATDARKSLFPLIEQVNDDHTTIEIVSKKGNAVLLSKDDYDSIVETAHLLSSPVNAMRLIRSLEATRRGEYTERELLE